MKRVYHAQSGQDASQDQAFACDHTCVIPINIALANYAYVHESWHAGYFALSFTRAHRTD